MLAERDVTDADGKPYPAVVVDDAVLAMGALAAEAVRRIRSAREQRGEEFTVIGITGSAGKTTTKDLLAGVLSQAGPRWLRGAHTTVRLGSPDGLCCRYGHSLPRH